MDGLLFIKINNEDERCAGGRRQPIRGARRQRQSFHISLCNSGGAAVHNSKKEVRALPSCLSHWFAEVPYLILYALCTQYEVVPYSQSGLLKVPDLRRIIHALVLWIIFGNPPVHVYGRLRSCDFSSGDASDYGTKPRTQ